MQAEFDKSLLFGNIAYLIKKKGKKVGELELAAGVSPGYISRTKEGNTKPGIDFIMKVANILDVSIDALLKTDITGLTTTEKYLFRFIEKLIKDTRSCKLDWQIETPGYLNRRLEVDIDGDCHHPLFSVETFFEKGETEYPDEITRTTFISHAYDVHTWINGDCFNLRMKDEAILYIMKISKSVYKQGDPCAHAIELWMHSGSGDNQFLCSTIDKTEISDLIYQFYSTVAEYARHPKVKKEIQEVIDDYMNDGSEDDEDFSDLPF